MILLIAIAELRSDASASIGLPHLMNMVLQQVCIKLSVPPLAGPEGRIKSKGLVMGKKIKSYKRRKKKIFKDFTLLVVLNGSL